MHPHPTLRVDPIRKMLAESPEQSPAQSKATKPLKTQGNPTGAEPARTHSRPINPPTDPQKYPKLKPTTHRADAASALENGFEFSNSISGHRWTEPARLEALDRQVFVIRSTARIVLALALAAPFAKPASAAPEVAPTLQAIENHYNHANSLRLEFSETLITSRRPAQNETGILYLRKPGRMRWEYAAPVGKVFLSDGKNTWAYDPDEHKAEKSSLKQIEDMRAPLAFLLGKLDFHKDFKSFESRTEGAANWIVALPKSQNLPYIQVDFQATPDGILHKVRVTNQDQSKLEFSFTNEQLNVPVADTLFVFRAPAGVQIVEAQP